HGFTIPVGCRPPTHPSPRVITPMSARSIRVAVSWLGALRPLGLMSRKQKCPLRAQLPVSASVVRGYDIVVGGAVGIDCLMADLEKAPDAAADRHGPAIVVISFPVGGDKRAGGQVPTLGEVIIEEGLQRHGIHVFPVLIASKGPEVKDQEASCYVQRPVRQED